ncbi:hypothetical protein AVEN_229363-1 [Araneus ventricosus]|uniref:RNase H type-1 domain-containing protein n=1 Tax=Araneus ventricosus TaxID=182803 RepID=A0A4Y2I293_ARAVE|nr:hypothetical protein AVEN_229363-1 [Araneus ventricosus]
MFADDVFLLASDTVSYKFTNSMVNPLKEIELWAKKFNLIINPDKSKFIVFPFSKKITHIPRLKICDQNIRNVKEFKHLGLIFDDRLTWMPHLNNIRLSRATWGARPTVLKEIYLRAVEKFILYGAPIWYSKNVKLRNKILQIQRIPLLNICKSYRTVSIDALHILCGCPPLDLVARNESILFDLYVRHSPITLGERSINFEDVSHFVNVEPPWNVNSFPWEYGNPEDHFGIKIFTDGSKLNNRVGLGIVCLDENGDQLWNLSERLSDEASVFIAEATAIFRAIE